MALGAEQFYSIALFLSMAVAMHTILSMPQLGARSAFNIRTFLFGLQERSEVLARKTGIERRLANAVRKSGVRFFSAGQTLLISVTLFVGLTLLVTFGLNNPLAGLLVGLVGAWLPFEIGALLAQTATTNLRQQIPGFLLSLSNYYANTDNILESFRSCIERTSQPLSGHIRRLILDVKNGVSLTDALDRFGNSTESKELKQFADTLIICYQHGGDLREALITLADQAQERSVDEQERVSGVSTALIYVVAIIGVTVLVLLASLRLFPESAVFLTGTTPGRGIVAFSFATTAGLLFMARRMLKMED